MNRGIHKKRDGIALIVVLGMLSLLTMLAVAFVISMRTERLAAKNSLDLVKARHYLHVALAEALDGVETDFGNEPYPDFSVSPPPLKDVYISFGGKKPINFLFGEVTNFIPRSAMADALAGEGDPDFGWEEIEDPDAGQTIGRYAYMVINCSGLLDANVVGGNGHLHGFSPKEIILTNIPGIAAASFFSDRATNIVRFETLPEIQMASGIDAGTVDSLFPYSRFIDDGLNPKGNPKVRLDLPMASDFVTAKGDIINALTDSKVPTPNDVYLNLIDYVDADRIPGNENGNLAANTLTFCTEAVPFINEISFSNKLTKINPNPTNTVWQLEVKMLVETWYPFPNHPNLGPDFTLAPDIEVVTSDPPAFKPQIPSTYVATPAEQKGYPGYSFQVTSYDLSPPAFTNPSLVGSKIWNYVINVKKIDLVTDEGIVDSVGPLDNLTLMVLKSPNFQSGLEVSDPRLNHDKSKWHVQAGVSTINQTNANIYVDGIGEKFSPMYASSKAPPDKPLESVAELGFLSIGKPWETIRLHSSGDDNDIHPVLDYFTIGTSGGSTNQGLVNINSRVTNALAAVFNELPIERYPDDDVPVFLSWADAKTCAGTLVSYLWDESGSHRISNDLSRLGGAVYTNSTTKLKSDAEIESLIRNSCHLLSSRQNLFTVLLAAQVYDGDAVFAEQRAVAVVWRDPVPDADGRHPCFVRFFKLLAE